MSNQIKCAAQEAAGASAPGVNAIDISSKEYTRSVVSCVRQWKTELDLPADNSAVSEMQIAAAVRTLARRITDEACRRVGREVPFTADNIPMDANLVACFSLFLLAGMHSALARDGVDLDFKTLGLEYLNGLFNRIPQASKAEYVVDAVETFQAIATSEQKIVYEWHDNLIKLVNLYLTRNTTDDPKLAEVDCEELFGGMLIGLLETEI